ncbi:PrgI family protein [Patescibacteria group bacterium]|nr:PrgI family protein [Patescibacteria group bacterium]
MAQYKVPQNIDIEDKVVGPLTIRQFLIILVTAGIILILNLFLSFLGPIFYMIAFLIGTLGIGLAFFKYGDQNAELFIISAFKTFTNPRKRVWQKEEPRQASSAKPQEDNTKKEEEEYVSTRANVSEARSHLEKLAEVVDSGGYSALQKNVPPATSTEAPDLLEKTERPDESFEQLVSEVTKKAKKREQLISEVASVAPDESLKTTQTIDTKIKRF